MAVDLKRLAAVAVEAALKDERPAEPGRNSAPARRSTFGGMRGVAAGAALVAAGRFAAKRAPSPMSLVGDLHKPDLSEIGDRMRDLIDDWFGEEDAYDGPDGGEDRDEDFEDDGPTDEVEDEADGDIDDEAEGDIDDEAEGDIDEDE